jgi:chorismate synthase
MRSTAANFDAPRSATTRSSAPMPPPQRWEKLVDEARKAGSSLGAVVECVATGVPAGWGAPLYAKLDADLAAAMMGINAVKGVEIGDGFAAARLTGEGNADPMRPGDGRARVSTANHAGGIAGGISTGQPVVVRVAFKPTSSILTPVPRSPAMARRPNCSPRAATIPASAFAACRWSKR